MTSNDSTAPHCERDDQGNHKDMTIAAIRQRQAERVSWREKLFGKPSAEAPKDENAQ